MGEKVAGRNMIEILVVEDSPTQAEQLRFILEAGGFGVSVASNGKEALAHLLTHQPDIVVSDIIMPEMDGYELCKQIRTNPNHRDIPVVLVTTLSDPTDVIKGLEVGATNFITKPYDEKFLISRIQYLIANRDLRKDSKAEMGISVYFSGQNYHITAERLQILDLLLSTYENAYRQNCELLAIQEELTALNERLEETVQERDAEIAERKKTEGALRESEERYREQNAVLQGMNRIFRETLACDSEQELGRICLDVAEKITESKFGFIGEIGPDGLLHDIAISETGWEMCTMYDKTGHRRPPGNFRIEGLYGRVLRDGKSLLVNDPSTHPDSIGVPDGHPQLTSFLGIPLAREGQTMGMIAVANREGGYSQEDLESLESLSLAIVEALVRKRAEQALKIAHNELEGRVEERTEELRQAYNRLTEETREKEQLEQELRQAQKIEALGTMSGGIAHDFNNILAAIIGFTELLEGHTSEGSRDAHHLHRIMEAGIRGRELVRQMLTFSRKAEQEKKPLALSSIVKETVKLLRATTPSTIGIRVNASKEALVLGDPTQIHQVLMNLCTNAVYAMQEKGGNLDIELSDYTVSPSNGDPQGIAPGLYVKLIVRDTGTGIPADIMDKIFDPFFTTKGVGEGTGLGLSVVHGIVKQHDGSITVISELGKGSTFTVYFPRITGDLKADALHGDETPTGSERILFVDDEEALVEMGEDILAELGYEVTSRMSSRDALGLLEEDPSRFDLVITDQTMPEMTGVDLAKEILALRADMPIIMCTGFSHTVDADKAKTAGIKAFAMKPLTKKEIARTIREVLDEPTAT